MFKNIIVLLCLLLTAIGFTKAQTVQGVVTGNVTDATGAAVPNAEVTLLNEDTAVTQREMTENNGTYRFPLVPPGVYTVTIKAGGFTTR
ncbi:MAG: carboxypeptidase regulatory-like domain-containing protein, partial [Acidobacteriaceae bacterium]|nr:carboxypeptidase regulatory-like domain-containing protein [Acidobacteriaceae bacterium]